MSLALGREGYPAWVLANFSKSIKGHTERFCPQRLILVFPTRIKVTAPPCTSYNTHLSEVENA